MLILNANEVRQSLPMNQTIEAMKTAFAALSNGQVEMPLRLRVPVAPQDGTSLFMPAYVKGDHSESLAVKIVSLFPNNPSLDLPFIHAAVIVLDPKTGQPVALLEGGALTAIRTGAGCGAATDLLANKDCQVVAIFGAGVQARTQLEAICNARKINTVWIYAPTRAHVEALIKDVEGKDPIPSDLRVADNPEQAVDNADIIAAATTSTTPVFADTNLKPGVHINGAGSYTPEMQEIPPESVQRALVTVDSRDAVLSEAGDLIQPIQSGLIKEDHIYAEIGEIVNGTKSGREDDDQITFFKSVGVAVQDAVAAQLALENARDMGLGQKVNW